MTKSDSSENDRPSTPSKRVLDGIRSPADIKALSEQDLPQLAQEVRDELIRVLSQTGGHLGPNLGVVELTIASASRVQHAAGSICHGREPSGLCPQDVYRATRSVSTMRQFGGLNGFLLRTESEHDCYGAGHAGTALSAALGMAVGRDLRGGDEHIVVVAGDAAFTCGISYEALNNVKAQTKRFIVVLNDNEWSIAKNVGAIANYLNSIVTNPTYAHLHEKARDFVQAILGKTGVHLAHKVEESVKGLLVPSVIFEELGLRYYGPIDGHDIPLLIRTFEFLKNAGRAGAAAYSDQKRQGLRTGYQTAGQISRARQIQDRERRDRADADADLFGDHRQVAGQIRRDKSKSRRHHGGDAERHWAVAFCQSASRLAISTLASRKNTRRSLPAGSPPRV